MGDKSVNISEIRGEKGKRKNFKVTDEDNIISDT